MISALLLYILSTYHPPTVVFGGSDTGFGKCKMDQHYHNSDDLCHRDSDDSPVFILPLA